MAQIPCMQQQAAELKLKMLQPATGQQTETEIESCRPEHQQQLPCHQQSKAHTQTAHISSLIELLNLGHAPALCIVIANINLDEVADIHLHSQPQERALVPSAVPSAVPTCAMQ